MPQAAANGITIEYEAFGARDNPPLLLVNGLGSQLLGYAEEFCGMLAARGHYVIRFDNRDVGLSTKFDAAGPPDMEAIRADRERGETPAVAYTLWDMADDAAGLLDALGIARAHIMGMSMGGMIVQCIAIKHPQRVLSMTSIMSNTGNPNLPAASAETQAVFSKAVPAERDPYIEDAVARQRVMGSPPPLFDEARVRHVAAARFDRSFYPVGSDRQLAGIIATGDRREALRKLTTPTLVIHGAVDPLVLPEGGIDTAANIPGARLVILDGMGHDLPPGLWSRITDEVCAHTGAGAAGK